ncbi:UNKNOWN [Stylonychia lemnae]|uniref:Uncharacterized protein n=1 Tax=Stylonychia lemnae TaxID=5949 RepID=A0A078A016_STYLE|nr:UNKNOWN [Stylonychia lemnae]|eukprot:CDW75485.1 UNKNOWN [Stylonychia lemnae]
MKKEKQNSNNLLQRAATQSKYSKKTKSPASSSQPKSSNNHSYSPNPSLQREMSPNYSLTRGNPNVPQIQGQQYNQVKLQKSKSKQQKSIQQSSNMSRLSMNSFANKRLSMPKNVSQPLNKVPGEPSLNQSIGNESFYSGDNGKQGKSPRSLMIVQQKKRQHYSTSTNNTPANGRQYSSGGNHNIIVQKKRNSQVSQTASNQHNEMTLQQYVGNGVNNPIYHAGAKQINNYLIEANLNANQILNQQKQNKQPAFSTKSSGINNKVLAVSNINQNISNHQSKHAVSATNKVSTTFTQNQNNMNNNVKFVERRLSAKILDNHKKAHLKGNAIQYENLMLQQLLKQQQKDQQAFNKNMSVISIDPVPSLQQLAPHMMLNISYNMNNNINHHTSSDPGAHFMISNQDPSQIKNLLGGFSHSTEDQQRSLMEQARAYKTQVQSSQSKLNNSIATVNSVGLAPQNYNLNNSLINQTVIEGQMSYENSILGGAKSIDKKYRDQSFDVTKPTKKKINSNKRQKQLSGNSSRRKNQNAAENQKFSQSRSNSSKRRSNVSNHYGAQVRESSRVFSSNNPTSSHSNSSNHYQNKINNQKISFKKIRNSMIDKSNEATPYDESKQLSFEYKRQQQSEEDRLLLQKLDEALARDLIDKSSAQKVAICSKVWSEIIRREDSVIASLLSKIKSSYEFHIKSQNKVLQQQQKEIDFEQELKQERLERKNAESKIENLSLELKRQQQCIDKQELVIQDMKKQILAYRQEIIELSTSKRYSKARRDLRGGSDMESSKVPRLDLSKVKRDSEEEDEEDDDESDNSKKQKKVKNGENVTYQQYLKFLENESRFDEMGEESQESIMRQEELKQRKNKIIQLLNGEISEDDGEVHIDQSSGGGLEDDLERDNGNIQDDEYNDNQYAMGHGSNLNLDPDDSNPPSTVKKQKDLRTNSSGGGPHKLVDPEGNLKSKHQTNKNGLAGANQKHQSKVRDFNQQLQDQDGEDDLDADHDQQQEEDDDDDDDYLDGMEQEIDLIRHQNRSAQSF